MINLIWAIYSFICSFLQFILCFVNHTGDPLHGQALAHSRAPLFTQPCPHCSHSRAPEEQWARLCVFTLQGCVQAARLCRGSPVIMEMKISCFQPMFYLCACIILYLNKFTWITSSQNCRLHIIFGVFYIQFTYSLSLFVDSKYICL